MRDYLQSLSTESIRTVLNYSEPLIDPVLGEPPTNALGAKLDPRLHALAVAAKPFSLRTLLEQGVTASRTLSRLGMQLFDIDTIELPRVENYVIDGPGGKLTLRYYSPDPTSVLPGCVFYHGGGFVLGNLDTHDGFCRLLAKRARCHVVSVDYRRAPEHPFPAAVEDSVAAFRWVQEHSDDLNIDTNRLAVAGDSAGGTLATVVCQEQIVDAEKRPDFQLLLYPKTDHGGNYPSRHRAAENCLLTWEAVEWFAEQYVPDDRVIPETDHRISPLRFDALDEMPPTLLATAGFDPLRDEGEAYADALEDNGVPVDRHLYEQLVHGFISLGEIIGEAKEAMHEISDCFSEEIHRGYQHERNQK